MKQRMVLRVVNMNKEMSEYKKATFVKLKGNDWERDFVDCVLSSIKKGTPLSLKQRVCWNKIQKKYFVDETEKQTILPDEIDFSPITFIDKKKEAIQRKA